MTNYIQNNLLPNEEIIHRAEYHWVHFISWISLFTLGIWPFVQSQTDEFIVTNRRVASKNGWIVVDTFEMDLSRIETINIYQSIFGRIFNYGNVTIVGTGGTRKTFGYSVSTSATYFGSNCATFKIK